MNKAFVLQRILLAPAPLRSALVPISMRTTSFPTRRYSSQNIGQASFWVSLIPKAFRKSPKSLWKQAKKAKSTEWNPATFYIWIFLLIGSMSIQMIALRNESAAFNRRADAKIGLLKEVIERIQKGEDVDVEGLLGAGDANREKEWEEVLQEIEREDEAWEQSRKSKPKHGQTLEEEQVAEQTAPAPKVEDIRKKEKPKKTAPAGFF